MRQLTNRQLGKVKQKIKQFVKSNDDINDFSKKDLASFLDATQSYRWEFYGDNENQGIINEVNYFTFSKKDLIPIAENEKNEFFSTVDRCLL